MNDSPLMARIGHPVWRVVVGLALCVLLVLLAAWLSGWVAAVVVGVVWGVAILAIATHLDQYVAWQRRRPVVSALALWPLLVPPLSQRLRRREEQYLETWKRDLGYVVDTNDAPLPGS